MIQTVICMKWGTLYGSDYVNKLYSMVSRNTQRPLRFICFTDDTLGIRSEVETHPLPPINLPPQMAHRPWRKISLWQDSLIDLRGPALFLDLDIVVSGLIDDFFDFCPASTFCVIHNWTTRSRLSKIYSRVGNTSCYRFDVGAHAYLFEMLEKDPLHFLRKYRNSQTFISNEIKEMDYWPGEWCVSFKHSLMPPWPLRLFRAPNLPPETKLIAFTGKPDVHEALAGEWPEPNPVKKMFKHFKSPGWLAVHWQ